MIEPMSQEDAEAIAGWQYEPPYDFYDGDADPGDLAELLDAERRRKSHWSAKGDAEELIGFFYYAQRDAALEIGLGLRPDLTGRGRGLAFFEEGLAFARARFDARRIILNVAAFNQRAIKVYEHAGFRETGRHVRSFERWGDVEFVEMEEQR